MVFSGQIYTAAELHEMGVVDVLAEDAMGEQAVYDFVEKTERSFASRRAVYAARQVINPIRREELDRIVDMWVDAALSLSPPTCARWSGSLPLRIAAGPRSLPRPGSDRQRLVDRHGTRAAAGRSCG